MVNYWIFQANPFTFFMVDKYLSDYVNRKKDIVNYWKVGKYKDRVKVDDIAFVWKAKGKTSLEAGIYAVVRIVKDAKLYAFTSAQIAPLKPYYVPGFERRLKELKWRVRIQWTRKELVHAPLGQSQLWQYRLKNPSWCRSGLVKLRERMSYTTDSVYFVELSEARIIQDLINENLGKSL